MDIWVFSVLYLVIFYALGVKMSASDVIHCLFPVAFSDYWYLTCYLIIYAIHPIINSAINQMNRKQLKLFVIVSLLMYSGETLISDSCLYWSNALIQLLVLYFAVAYFKKYHDCHKTSNLCNLTKLLFSIVLLCILVISINYLGLRYEFFSNKILILKNNLGPVVLFIAFSAFKFFKGFNFYNGSINYVSKLSMLIYIIHENYWIRVHFRPYIFAYIYENFGYNNLLVLWVLLLIIAFFIGSSLIAVLYKVTIQKLVIIISDIGERLIKRYMY